MIVIIFLSHRCDAVNHLVYFRGILAWPVIVIVSWAIEGNLVIFEDYSGWAYNCDSFLGYRELLSLFLGYSSL